MTLELDDLVGSYPDVTDPLFQEKITAKREFYELTTGSTEIPPVRGQLFKHQNIIKRFMMFMDKCLLVHAVGTGKSCSFIAVAEYYKHLKLKKEIENEMPQIDRAIVLVKGPILESEFKYQLVCKCNAAGEYETDIVRSARTEKVRASNITREVHRFYTVKGYQAMANDLENLTDEEIVRGYSNKLIVIDEVHNLRVNMDANPDNPNTMEENETLKKTYTQIWRMLHLIKNSKILLLSGTPIINQPEEIAGIMNLILPENRQMPDADYRKITLEEIVPYLNGLVSYVRQLDTGAIPKYMGERIQGSFEDINGKSHDYHSVVYPVTMSPFQTASFARAALTNANFYEQQRQSSMFVYPDGSYGAEGYRKYVKELGKDDYEMTDEFKRSLIRSIQDNKRGGIWWYSSKFNQTILDIQTKPGNMFQYLEFVTGSGAVAFSLCLSLYGYKKFNEITSVFIGERPQEENDNQYHPDEELFNTNLSKSICETQDNIQRKIRIKHEKRFGLLTSETPSTRAKSMLELMNSYENRHSEYIKTIVGSRVTRDGLNISNVLEVDILAPPWNPSSGIQAIYRAIRATSHVLLLKEKAEDLAKEGKNPDEATIDIEIFRMVSLPNPSLQSVGWFIIQNNYRESNSSQDFDSFADNYISTNKAVRYLVESEDVDFVEGMEMFQDIFPGIVSKETITHFTNLNPIDLSLYGASEEKDFYIHRIMRFIKICAFDCQILKERNLRPGDIDGTEICDYQECNYECINPAPKDIDETTFRIWYSQSLIEEIKQKIQNMFSINLFETSLDVIYDKFKNLELKLPSESLGNNSYKYYVDQAIIDLVRNQIPIRNRYGFSSYFNFDGHFLYLQREFPSISTTSISSFYSSNLAFVGMEHLSEIASEEQLPQQMQLMSLVLTQSAGENVSEKISELNVNARAALLEESVLRYNKILETGSNVIPENIKRIINYFTPSMIFYISRPDAALTAFKNYIATKSGKVTGKALQTIKTTLGENISPIKVYIHIVYALDFAGQPKYKVIPRIMKIQGKIRIFDPTEGMGWRDVNEEELPVYTEIVQRHYDTEMEKFDSEFEIYGIYVRSVKGFYIRNQTTEFDENGDKRRINRGRNCDSQDNHVLIHILWKLGIQPNVNVIIPPRDYIIKELLTKKGKEKDVEVDIHLWDDQRLIFYYKWHQVSRDTICDKLEEIMKSLGRMRII